MKLTAINIMKSFTRNKSCHIARRVDKQGARPSVSDQSGIETLAAGLKFPVNNGPKTAHTRPWPSNGPSVINTNDVTKTKNTKIKTTKS